MQPPHHVLHAVGRLDHADEQIPVAGVDAAEDHLRAIVERLVEVLHERLLVHAPFVQRPRRLGPSERPVVAEPLEEIAGERRRRRHRQRRRVRLPVDRRDVQLQLVVRLHQQQLRHAVQAHEEVDAELEVDPPAHLAGSSSSDCPCDFDRRGLRRAVPPDRHRHADVFLRLQLRDRRAILIAQRRPLARGSPGSWLRTIGLGGPMSSVRATSCSITQPLEDAAELRVAFLVAAQVGREVIERAHRPADVGQRQSREELAVRHVFGRKRDRHREDARAHAGLAGRDPERRAAADREELRLRDRDVAEQEARRLAPHHPEIRQGTSPCRARESRRCCACRD